MNRPNPEIIACTLNPNPATVITTPCRSTFNPNPEIGWFSMEDWRGGGYKYIVIISPWLLSPTAVHAARVYLDVKSADQALHGSSTYLQGMTSRNYWPFSSNLDRSRFHTFTDIASEEVGPDENLTCGMNQWGEI
ncbi:hypothetical protein RRG08_043959 [Elysia crispata]|uniref:Uncharacterized protein n=1 Tax=Elysia crispata TaxID=231223 RepID=A0AAE1CQ98_9GAST|nr:hypothetical protein RRG08_043959 [Elysia crispata]